MRKILLTAAWLLGASIATAQAQYTRLRIHMLYT